MHPVVSINALALPGISQRHQLPGVGPLRFKVQGSASWLLAGAGCFRNL